MRIAALLLGLGLAATGAAWADMMPLRPPAQWEEHVTPGFKPSVESVLVNWAPDEDKLREQLRAWGPESVPVLIGLLEQDTWKDFRGRAVFLLSVSDYDQAHEYLKKRYLAAAKGEDPERGTVYLWSYALMRTGVEEFLALLEDQAVNGTGEIQAAALSAFEQLPSERSLAILKRAAAKMDEARRKSFEEYELAPLEGRVRAQQPMSAVVEKEKQP